MCSMFIGLDSEPGIKKTMALGQRSIVAGRLQPNKGYLIDYSDYMREELKERLING